MGSNIDFRTLDPPRPDVLAFLPLQIGVLHNEQSHTAIFAELVRRYTSWRPFPFESIEHLQDILGREHLHVLLIHWHIGPDHSLDNHVTKLVKQIKAERGGPGVGRGPFIVATVTSSVKEFSPGIDFLTETYDCHIVVPFLGGASLVETLSSQLFLLLPVNVLRQMELLDVANF